MEKEYFIIVAVILILIIIGFFASSIRQIFSAPVVVAESCEKILVNKGDKKIDIVFFTENIDKAKVNEYSDFLINSEPFSSNKEKFNFYYAGSTQQCDLYGENILLCYSKDLIKQSAVCPNDYVFVLADRDSNIRSSSYMNVLSINIRHPKSVLLHEFGHTFANLADEYIPSVIPRGAKNCETNCEKFDEEKIDGCYEGCSKETYFRSSQTSVMRTLNTEDYKKLNTFIIKENLNAYE